MRQFKLTLFLLFCLLSIAGFSQTKSSASIKKNCHYTFSGELSPQTKTQFEESVLKLSDVTSAKVKYKSDSKAGELFFSVSERPKTSEGDESGFNLFELKKLILSYNITPLEFTVTE